MGIFSFIGDIFAPAADLIDDIHVSDEERMELRNEFAAIQEKAQAKILELEMAKVNALANVQVAEASSEFWLTANWRPLSILILMTLVVLGSFDLIQIGPEISELLKLLFGVYAGGRSLEKISKVVKLGGN